MIIDEDRNYCLTNYNKQPGKTRPVESDHNPLILYLNISCPRTIKQRVEIYNLKNMEGQNRFNEITSFSTNLSDCLESGKPLNDAVKDWESNFTFALSQSFTKIRITDKHKLSESDQFIA